MVWLMFPAYNEEKNLVKLLPEMCKFLDEKIDKYEVLIINDGSKDATGTIDRFFNPSLPIRIVSHEKNKGIGEVFRTGLSAIGRLAGDDDLLIVLEADGTSDYKLIPAIVEKLRAGSDVVIASRYVRGGAYKNFPLKRHIISVGANFLMRCFFMKNGVRDYTIFYRGYRVDLIKKAISAYGERLTSSKTFFANAEILINLMKLTNRINEVPFIYSYEKKIGKSKMPVLKTFFDYLRFILARKLDTKP